MHIYYCILISIIIILINNKSNNLNQFLAFINNNIFNVTNYLFISKTNKTSKFT